MRHQNSVFHGLLKQVPWSCFDKLVDEYGADRGVRRLSTKSQLIALLYGQLAGASSLREIETALASHGAQLYHLGAGEISRSTLADANGDARMRSSADCSRGWRPRRGAACAGPRPKRSG